MAGPGKRGAVRRLITTGNLATNTALPQCSKEGTSRTVDSGASNFVTPNGSSPESQCERGNRGQPHTSESHVSGQSEDHGTNGTGKPDITGLNFQSLCLHVLGVINLFIPNFSTELSRQFTCDQLQGCIGIKRSNLLHYN